jgi:hypothetical protein
MTISLGKLVSATVLSVALVAGAVAAPSIAATADTLPVVVTGHVTTSDGEPISGIVVSAECPCDFEGAQMPADVAGVDTTSRTGFYRFVVQQRYVEFTTFYDPSDKYLSASKSDATTTKRGSAFVIDVELDRASELAGTVRDATGAPV